MKNLHKLGIKKAYTVFNNNLRKPKFIFNYFRNCNTKDFNQVYVDRFEQAYLTFKYQRVWCPRKQKMVSLNSFKEMDLFDEKDLETIHLTPTDLMYKVNDFDETALLVKHSQKPEGISFLGPILDQTILKEIAECKRDPIGKELFKDIVSFNNYITDKKYDNLRNLASEVSKNVATTSTVCELKFGIKTQSGKSGNLPPKPTTTITQTLTSFFEASQSGSLALLKRSKETIKSNGEYQQTQFTSEIEENCRKLVDEISDEDEGLEFNNQMITSHRKSKGNLMDEEKPSDGKILNEFSQRVAGTEFVSSLKGPKAIKGFRDVLHSLKIENKSRSISGSVLASFRTAYIETQKNHK